VPGRGIVASYGPPFWALVALIGLGAGLGGAALIELLRAIQHLAWGYSSGGFLEAAQRSSDSRRLLVLALGGVIAGGGALALSRGGAVEVSEALWLRGARLPLVASLARAVHSIVVVALGASLGREAGPQQVGAALASTLSQRARLPGWQRRLLVACGAGAGMAAVYNVPLGGALFALEVLLGTLTLPFVLPALACSLIATAVAWIVVPSHPTYTIPSYGVSASLVVWALLVGPLAGLAAVAYVHLIVRAHAVRPRGWLRLAAPIVVFTALGALAMAYPQLLGNGKGVVQLALVGQLGVALLAVLLVLKPIVTAACLGSGAPGGLFTPTLAYGVLLGALLGKGWAELWPGAPLGSYAIVGGAAVLGACMQGPLAAVVLLLELTHHAWRRPCSRACCAHRRSTLRGCPRGRRPEAAAGFPGEPSQIPPRAGGSQEALEHARDRPRAELHRIGGQPLVLGVDQLHKGHVLGQLHRQEAIGLDAQAREEAPVGDAREQQRDGLAGGIQLVQRAGQRVEHRHVGLPAARVVADELEVDLDAGERPQLGVDVLGAEAGEQAAVQLQRDLIGDHVDLLSACEDRGARGVVQQRIEGTRAIAHHVEQAVGQPGGE
jgi:H+/Cl- antiporter ClcA